MQDFPERGVNPREGARQPIIWPKFVKNRMKMQKVGPGRGRPKFYSVDPPLIVLF